MISIDDFYMPAACAPKDEDGKPDLEHIDALDRALFFRNALIFSSPSRGRKGKSLRELIDEVFRRAIPDHIGNIQNF